METLPAELLDIIFALLLTADLASLATVSKRLGALAETRLWTDVEFHPLGYHDVEFRPGRPPPALLRRQEHPTPALRTFGPDLEDKAFCFFNTLLSEEARAAGAASPAARVRTLCTATPNLRDRRPEGAPGQWSVFPEFVNLETLEIHATDDALQDVVGAPFDLSAPALPRLRSAKLEGYVPRGFVQYILRSAPTLQRLELAVLDAPVARSDEEPASATSSDSEDSSTQDDHLPRGCSIAPRPLSFLPAEIPSFPCLKFLRLCRPSESNPDNELGHWSGPYYSPHAGLSSLAEWRRLLRSTHSTLETLVLEHRVVAGDDQNDTYTEQEYIECASSGPAEVSFDETVRPILEAESFPCLQDVFMVGIYVGSTSEDSAAARRRLKHFWSDRGAQCHFLYGNWTYFDRDSGVATWTMRAFAKDDDDDDDDDGPED